MKIYNKQKWIKWILIISIWLTAGFGCSHMQMENLPYSPDSSNIFHTAEKLYSDKRYDKASRLYNEFISYDPNSSYADNALLRLGQIAMAEENYTQGIKSFQKLVNNYPNSELFPYARFEIAHSFFLNSSWDEALNELIKFKHDFPASQYSPEIQLMLSEVYVKTKNYHKAKDTALELIALYPDSRLKSRALFQLGLSQMYLKETDSAIEHLRQALFGDLSEDQKITTFYLLGSLYLNRGEVSLAVMNFSDLYNYADIKKKALISQKISELIREKVTDKDLMMIIKEYHEEFPGDLALIEMGERYFKEDDFSNARYYWELFLSRFPDHFLAPDIKDKLSFFERKPQEGNGLKFGCIAPLTGPLSLYGEKMVRGVKLAIEEYNQKFGTSVKVVLFDSQAKPDKAQKGVELLAYQEKVSAIIGPLLTSTTLASADLAESIGIPLFTPTATGEGITDSGDFIFRNCLTNRHQAEALAHYAVYEMGLTKFGILFPFNPYGQEMMSLFANQVEKVGAKIEIIEFYNQDDTDFKEQLIRIHKIKPDALFLPGSYEKIVLIAPQIPFYKPEIDPNDPNYIIVNTQELPNMEEMDIDNIDEIFLLKEYERERYEKGKEEEKHLQIFGTDGWYDKQLLKEGGSYVNGSVISVGFYPESNYYIIRRFCNSFQKKYGEPPDIVSAQSYDATNMLLEASSGGQTSWETIRDRLYKIHDFPGVSGRTTILPSGDSEKEVTLLKIKNNRFVPVNVTGTVPLT